MRQPVTLRIMNRPNHVLTLRQFCKEYDQLYSEVQALFAKYNPCDIRNGTCAGYRGGARDNFCCARCKHLTKKGCRVKSLACKVWICNYLYTTAPDEFKDQLHALSKRCSDLFYITHNEKVSKASSFRCSKTECVRNYRFVKDALLNQNKKGKAK